MTRRSTSSQTIQALRGVAFTEDGDERGLSWSDMAILLRSVKANAEPITRALSGGRHPVRRHRHDQSVRHGRGGGGPAALLLHRRPAGRGRGRRRDAPGRPRISASTRRRSIRRSRAPRGAKAALTDPDQKRWGQYSIQRVFLTFLEQAGVREERVPDGRGEVVFYNLGKFSQVISDFETIHFHSKPVEKYDSFADFLQYHAEDAYPEGWQDNQYANPDAVRIMTIHQAKGMQWPVVFVPALLKNRFPAKRHRRPQRLAPAAPRRHHRARRASRARSRTSGGSSTSR